MDRNAIPLASVGLSLLACALAVLALTRGSQPTVQASADPGPDAERVRELTDQTVALRADLDRFARASRDTSALRQPMETEPEPASVPPDLVQRLTSLEESLAALQRRSKERGAREPLDPAEAQRRARDPRASEDERIEALTALRRSSIGGKDGRSPDVVLAMIDLAEGSSNEGTRRTVYANLHGVTDRSLRDSMLRALAGDPSPRVREKVAEDFGTFLPDVEVERALRQAADGDADAKVRERALETLSQGRR